MTAGAAVAGAGHGASSDPGPDAPAPDAATVAQLRALVTRAASFARDPEPDSVRVYRTTRRTANAAAFEAVVEGDQRVHLIIARGHFVAVGMPKPSNDVPDATGYIMRMVWDPASRMMLDFGIGDNEPDTARLGSGFALDLSSS
jgi:hypothetical protein